MGESCSSAPAFSPLPTRAPCPALSPAPSHIPSTLAAVRRHNRPNTTLSPVLALSDSVEHRLVPPDFSLHRREHRDEADEWGECVYVVCGGVTGTRTGRPLAVFSSGVGGSDDHSQAQAPGNRLPDDRAGPLTHRKDCELGEVKVSAGDLTHLPGSSHIAAVTNALSVTRARPSRFDHRR